MELGKTILHILDSEKGNTCAVDVIPVELYLNQCSWTCSFLLPFPISLIRLISLHTPCNDKSNSRKVPQFRATGRAQPS